MARVRSLLTVPFGEDLVGGLGPGEWVGALDDADAEPPVPRRSGQGQQQAQQE